MSAPCDDNCRYVYSAEIYVDCDRQTHPNWKTLKGLFNRLHITARHGADVINELLFRPVQGRTVLGYKRKQVLDELSAFSIEYDLIRDHRSRKAISFRHHL